MADRYDNSFSRRPGSADGKPDRQNQPEAAGDEDPLVELARIVSGKSNFDDIVGGRPPAQAAPRVQPAPVRAPTRDASFDLESELLNDLQSSFDPAVRPPVQAPRAPEPKRDSFDRMQLRPGQPVAPRYEPPAEEDPYAGTAYASGNYDPRPAATQPTVRPATGYSAGQEGGAGDPGGYDDYYAEDGTQQPYYDEEPEYADGDQPYYGEDDQYEPEQAPPSRSRKGLITAAVVLAVVLAGGVAAMVLRDRGGSASSSAPQVIAADDSPTKVQPAAQPAETDGQQNKMIYDRAAQDPANEQLVLPDDGPVDEPVPSNESAGSREISRIILPGAPGDASSDAITDAMSAASAPNADTTADDSDAGPRKVRTVVVKPDGTIISSEAQPRGAALTKEVASNAPAAIPMTAPTADPASPVVSAPAATPSAGAAPAAAAAPTLPGAAEAPAMPKDTSQMAEPEPAARAAAPKPEVRPTPSAAPAAQIASAPAGSGYVVQVTSQRNEDQAREAYKALQRRFPSLLANQQPDIVRADLGAKGVFYRVRVGPTATRDQAVSFCEALRSAGGDCIVQKN